MEKERKTSGERLQQTLFQLNYFSELDSLRCDVVRIVLFATNVNVGARAVQTEKRIKIELATLN